MVKMGISPLRMLTAALTNRKIDIIPTLYHMIPYHQEQHDQEMANTPTVKGVRGVVLCWIGAGHITVWASELG